MISSFDDVNEEAVKTHERFRSILEAVELLADVDSRTDSQIAGVENMISLLHERIVASEMAASKLEAIVIFLGFALVVISSIVFMMIAVMAFMFLGIQ